MQHLRQILYLSVILIVLLLGRAGNSLAQQTPYVFQHLDREDGLASSIVLAMLEDKDGFMWFGSDNGLQRYDGRQYVHYRFNPHNPNSLASDMVEALLQDTKGYIWIAAPDQVTRFSPENQQFIRFPIQKTTENSNTPRRWRLRECNGKILLQSGNKQETFMLVPEQKAFILAEEEKVKAAACLNEVWPTIPQPSHEPAVYLKDKQNNIWAAAEQLWVQKAGASQFELIPQRNDLRYGILFDQIFSLVQSREGTIWLGTNKGLYSFNPAKQLFFTVSTASSRPGNPSEPATVSNFLETSSGEIWVSSLNQGIRVYDQQFRLLRSYNRNYQGKSLPVWSLTEDKQHQVWAGTSNGTLMLIRNKNAPPAFLKPAVFSNQDIVKASSDSKGNIWWGTHTGLLVRHTPEKNQFRSYPLPKPAGIPALGKIKQILFGPDGSVWVATSQAAVWQLHAETGEVLAHYSTASRPQGLLNNAVGDITWFNPTTLLISTSMGLHLLDTKSKKITPFTTANGLPFNTILNVVKGSGNYLFFTTQVSLSRWNTQTKTYTNYGPRDGLLNESYAFNTGYKLRDGRILLGTLQDFYYFYPDRLEKTVSPPPPIITGFRVFDKSIPLAGTSLKKEGMRLAYNQNFFTVEFASLQYADANKIAYEFQLEGVDKTWRNAGTNRFASYTNLDGGSYEFKVKARFVGDATTSSVTSFPLQIAQPFWKTWWFYLLMVASIMAAGYGFYKLRINRLLALQQVRTRIARDLHDDMGSTLSTIRIFSDMANEQVLQNPMLAQGYLSKISRYSHDMMGTMDDIVWSINPHNDSLPNLVARMREFAAELLEAKNIYFSFQVDPTLNTVRLPLEARYDCFMIFKEALNNLAKYSGCTQVWIKIALVNHQLKLEITDNGKGFDVQIASTGNGLKNMRKRATTIKGHLDINSEKEKGTTVLLTVPLSKTLLKPTLL